MGRKKTEETREKKVWKGTAGEKIVPIHQPDPKKAARIQGIKGEISRLQSELAELQGRSLPDW